VPTSLSFSYDNSILDLNPEGIGVQPMIVKVTMNFNIIGGMGLAKPVEQLQNALSFNYYANTEIYDERATFTEDTSALDKEIVDKIVGSQSPATTNNVNNVIPNNGGNTIGTIITNIPIPSGQTGETSYQAIMDTLLKETTNYFNLVVNKLESINNTYNYGVVQLLDSDRGDIKLPINNPNKNPIPEIEIYGKPKFEPIIQKSFELLLSDIDNDLNPIIRELNKVFKNENSPISQVKENLKKYIKNLESDFSNGIATTIQELVAGQDVFTKVIEKVNIVIGTTDNPENGLDGKILETGVPRLYRVTGTPQNTGTTKTEMIFDFAEVEKAFMNPGAGGIPINFVNLLNYFDIAFRPISYQDGNFSAKTDSFNGVNEKSDKQFFMVMSRIITNPTKKQKFIDEVISGNLKTYKTPVSLLNKFEKIVNQLENTYKKELNAEEKLFKDLRKNKEFKNLVEESIYEPRKPRKFEYNTAVEFTQEEKDKIINLYK
jgi:hypothetical protein